LRIVIVGASGLIGSVLATAARSAGHDVVGTYTTQAPPGLLRFDLTQTMADQASTYSAMLVGGGTVSPSALRPSI
jgi:nucleoside-diphosphate-sugar epimerase